MECTNIIPRRKNNVIQEMKRLELKILGCSEVRWTQSGKIRLDNMTFLYSGHEQDHKYSWP